jgi:hypothetical protein
MHTKSETGERVGVIAKRVERHAKARQGCGSQRRYLPTLLLRFTSTKVQILRLTRFSPYWYNSTHTSYYFALLVKKVQVLTLTRLPQPLRT